MKNSPVFATIAALVTVIYMAIFSFSWTAEFLKMSDLHEGKTSDFVYWTMFSFMIMYCWLIPAITGFIAIYSIPRRKKAVA